MTRRDLLIGAVATLGSPATLRADTSPLAAIALAARRGAADDRATAVRLHDFVRDEVRFGFTGAFYDMTAEQVLDARVGFCLTKATLFASLLHAAGIAARMHFVTIDAAILYGILEPGVPYVDHAFVEVDTGAGWVPTDSYIVDRRLWHGATAWVQRRGRRLGAGVHLDGTCEWDGHTPAFTQFVRTGRESLSDADHGVFADVDAFMRSGRARQLLTPSLRGVFPFVAWNARRRLARLRES